MNKVFQLKEAIKDEGFVYIQTHNFPDPDALASAFGLQFVLKQFKIRSRIIYSGFMIDKTMNDMAKMLKIKSRHTHSVEINKSSKIIIVDTQIGHKNTKKLDAKYIGCIDHHEIAGKRLSGFNDLRPEMGSCSTIIAQYIFDLKLKNIPKNVATALITGIYIDTFRLLRKVTSLDVEMIDKLFPFIHLEILRYLALKDNIDLQNLSRFEEGIKNLAVTGDIGVIKVSNLNSHHLLAVICDFFMQIRELNLIIGYSIKKNKIILSLRSDKKEYNASKIVNKIIRKIGTGGGHTVMAAGEIGLDRVRKNFNFEKYLNKIVKKIEMPVVKK